MPDFLPRRDNDFLNWASNFSSYVTAHSGELPIDAQQAAAVSTEVNGFRTNLNGHTAARDASQAACELKDEKKATAEAVIRNLARQFQASPDVTDAQRQAMGLPVRDSARTLAAEPDMRRPYGIIDTSKPFRHTLKYRQEDAAGRGRPEYAVGCEVWMKILPAGDPVPTKPEDLTYTGTNLASPYTCEFAAPTPARLRTIACDGWHGTAPKGRGRK